MGTDMLRGDQAASLQRHGGVAAATTAGVLRLELRRVGLPFGSPPALCRRGGQTSSPRPAASRHLVLDTRALAPRLSPRRVHIGEACPRGALVAPTPAATSPDQ